MTKEEITEMAKECNLIGMRPHLDGIYFELLEAFAKLVAQHEREACAEICDGFYLSWIDIQGRYEFMGEGASECAGAIRARGQE
jgi:hypothetical protein